MPMNATTDLNGYNYQVLNKARLRRGWTHMKLAEECGLNYSTVQRTLTGRRRNPETVKILAEFLGIPMEVVFP